MRPLGEVGRQSQRAKGLVGISQTRESDETEPMRSLTRTGGTVMSYL